jgi:hypothetical protein
MPLARLVSGGHTRFQGVLWRELFRAPAAGLYELYGLTEEEIAIVEGSDH